MSDELSHFELFIDLSGEFQAHIVEQSYLIDSYVLAEYIQRMILIENQPTPMMLLDLVLAFDLLGNSLDFIRNQFYVEPIYPADDYCNASVEMQNEPAQTNYVDLEIDVSLPEMKIIRDEMSIEFRNQTVNLNSFNSNT